ncbi:MAG: HEAT repeat domain-containing protein [Bacteroidota bacterium]
MGFYDLQKAERNNVVSEINAAIAADITTGSQDALRRYFSDGDTYIRKTAYLTIGRLYFADEQLLQPILHSLLLLFSDEDAKVRQTVVNAAGEIGKVDFAGVQQFFDKGLFDEHHSVRNAVIGSMKKMGEKNPGPVLAWSRGYLHHADKEIRREICHGIELRGRTHPQDILPLLEELQHDNTRRVRSTLVHVLGQIAYKKGCLETVVNTIKHWGNQQLVADAIEEIIDVHYRYRNFSFYTQEQAREYIADNYTVLKTAKEA